MRARVRLLVLALTSFLAPALGHATEPAKAATATPDAELLEFLGSGDDGDPELQQYLVKEDVAKAAPAKPAPKGGDGKT